jgi:ATP-binding cassette subfamily B multidrug efflux pump
VNADLILVMDQGEIVERGNHESLMQIRNGKYKCLIDRQFAGSAAQDATG